LILFLTLLLFPEKEESEPEQHVGEKRKADDGPVEKAKPAPPKIEPALLWRQLLLFGVLKAARVLFQSQSRSWVFAISLSMGPCDT
jgi:hypothetical protein